MGIGSRRLKTSSIKHFWSYKVWPDCSIRSKEGRAWVHYPEDRKLEDKEGMKDIYKDTNDHANFFRFRSN